MPLRPGVYFLRRNFAGKLRRQLLFCLLKNISCIIEPYSKCLNQCTQRTSSPVNSLILGSISAVCISAVGDFSDGCCRKQQTLIVRSKA